MKKGRGLVHVRGIAVFVVLMALLAAFCGWLWHNREEGKPTGLLGYEWMSMRSDEMEPEISKGSLLLLKEVQAEELEPGDVVVSGRMNGRGGSVYRILETEEAGVMAKSDRSQEAVSLSEDQIGCRVEFVVPAAGMIWDFLLTTRGMILVIVIPCVVFLVLELTGLFLIARRGRKNSGGPPNSSEADANENFIDVTDRYTGPSARRRYQEMEPPDAPDKFADLEFNPVMEKKQSSGLERVEIPDREETLLKLLIGGQEAASLPLDGPKNTRIKSGGWRIDISIIPDQESGK